MHQDGRLFDLHVAATRALMLDLGCGLPLGTDQDFIFLLADQEGHLQPSLPDAFGFLPGLPIITDGACSGSR